MEINREKNRKRPLFSFAILVFFSVSLNSDWAADSVLWWGSVGLLIIASVLGNNAKFVLKPSIVTKWWLAITILSVFSIIIAVDSSVVIDVLKTFIVLLIALVIIDSKLESYDDVTDILALYFISVLIVALYLLLFVDMSIFQQAIITRTDTGHWNGNEIGILMATGATVGLFAQFNSKSRFLKLLRWSAIIVFIYIMYLTSSRKALAMLLMGICFNIVLRKPSKIVRNVLLVAIAILGTYLLVLYVPALYETIGWRIESLFSIFTGKGTIDSSAALRFKYIESGWGFFKESPIWGYGANNFKVLNNMYNGANTYAHNNFIEILVNYGLIGFVIFYWIFIKTISEYIKNKVLDRNLILSFSVILMFLICHYGMVAISNLSQCLFLLIFFFLINNVKANNDYRKNI